MMQQTWNPAAAAAASLKEYGADALLVTSEYHQRYLSGFAFSDGYLLLTPEKQYLLTDFRYEEAALAAVGDRLTVLVPEEGVRAGLDGLITREGVGRLLVEETELSCAAKAALEERLPGVELILGGSRLLDRQRTRKSDLELDCIRRAQALTDAAFAHVLSMMQPTMTEREVALELEFFMRRNGAEGVAFETIAVSGPSSALPHGVPGDVKLRPGFLTMDFGAKVDGYCSDMTRTVVIGKADAEIRSVYDTVLQAQLAALDRAAEGVSCRSLDLTARAVIDGAGYAGRFGHGLGHGVGVLIHEAPRLSRAVDEKVCLERGNVVTFEPGIYLTGRYGCRIEDLVAVGNDGRIYNLTKSPKEMIELF